ncbi:MAG: hypothetical protein AAF320_03475 [Myxococcota bacterium]
MKKYMLAMSMASMIVLLFGQYTAAAQNDLKAEIQFEMKVEAFDPNEERNEINNEVDKRPVTAFHAAVRNTQYDDISDGRKSLYQEILDRIIREKPMLAFKAALDGFTNLHGVSKTRNKDHYKNLTIDIIKKQCSDNSARKDLAYEILFYLAETHMELSEEHEEKKKRVLEIILSVKNIAQIEAAIEQWKHKRKINKDDSKNLEEDENKKFSNPGSFYPLHYFVGKFILEASKRADAMQNHLLNLIDKELSK